MRWPLFFLVHPRRHAHRPRRPGRRRPGAAPAVALLLASLLLGGCGRPGSSVTGSASPPPPPPPAATPATTPVAPVPARPALPWLGRWVSAPGDEQVGFDLRADGTAQALIYKGWDRPQPIAGQWATNPDGRSASLVMTGGGFAPMTLLPGPAGLLARTGLGALALSACPGGRWPWQDVDFGRRELLDSQRADLESMNALLYYTAQGIDILEGNRRLAGRPTDKLAMGTLLSPEPILKAMRARLDVLIREGTDARWTEAAREPLTGGRDRLGHPYEFYWGSDGTYQVMVGVAPETRATFRPLEPAWRATHRNMFGETGGSNGNPWNNFIRPGSKEVEAAAPSPSTKPPSPLPASPAAVPFGPGAASVPPERRAELVTVVERGLRHERGNNILPVGDFEIFAGQEGWLARDEPARRRYNGATLDLLQRLAAQGLLTLTERVPVAAAGGASSSAAGSPAPVATKAYRLTPSERLRQMADPARSVPGQSLALPLFNFVVLRVDEARPWTESGLVAVAAENGAWLLVGTYQSLPEELYLTARPDYPRRDLRFRALLRPGPGGQDPRLTLTAFDRGTLEQEGWLTHEVP